MQLSKKKPTSKNINKTILIFIGNLFLLIGIIGIFVPILPTTPFILLAASCYFRSSEKYYNWLINNKWLGNYIRNYQEKKGITLTVKILFISVLWITIGFSIVFVVRILWIKLLMITIAIFVTIHIISIKTLKNNNTKDIM